MNFKKPGLNHNYLTQETSKGKTSYIESPHYLMSIQSVLFGC